MAASWGKHQQAALHTVPYSQYSEIARWAMQLAGEDFEEKPHLPTPREMKRCATSPTSRTPSSQTSRTSSWTSRTPSSRMRIRFRTSSWRCDDSPCYVAPDGERLDDCWQILERFVGEVPADVAELLSCEVGPQVHALFNHFVLAPEMACTRRPTGVTARVKRWQQRLCSLTSSRAGGTVHGFAAKEEDTAEDNAFILATRRDLEESLSKLEHLLLLPGNPFVPKRDGRPSPAGLALASLLAPLVDAEDYTGGRCNVVRSAGGVSAFPESFQQLVAECRSRLIGKFVLETYKERMNFGAESTTDGSSGGEYDSSPYPGLF